MKEKEQEQNLNQVNKGITYFHMMAIYLTVFFVTLISVIFIFDKLIDEHDKTLTKEMCNLVAEKINSSIEYMTSSVDDISNLISSSEYDSMEDAYADLKKTVEKSDYLSVGIIKNDGTIYASQTEKEEIEKWDLISLALGGDDIVISEPYRSGLTGQMVFSMFSGYYNGDKKEGSIYLTYPLEKIQEMAHTKSLQKEAEVYLMDQYSDNLINCSGTSEYSAGSWNNVKLDKSRIKGNEFEKWQELMRSGADSGAVVYSLDGITYSQVFEHINFMSGWNVVVKLPSNALSNVMQIFRMIVVIFAVFLVVATLILLYFTHRREESEKKMFENLSIYDPLTKIMNRRAFEFSANQQIGGRYLKTDQALMFIDIDFFKHVNDNYGHDAGDYILTEVADGLKTVFGENSLIARYGGDEFIVLTKFSSKESVNEKLEKLRSIYSEVKIKDAKVDASDFHLHFSSGIAAYPSDCDDLKGLLKCADKALYEVKERGRNGYEWYKPEEV